MRRFVKQWAVAAILLATLTIGDVRAQTDADADQDDLTAPANVSVEPSVRDSQISERLSNILEATGWYSNISVRVEEGIVFLSGSTNREPRKVWARDMAAKTQDVVAVVNNISVRTETSWSLQPAADALSGLARSAIASGPLIVLALLFVPIVWIAAHYARRLARWLLRRRISSPMLLRVVSNLVVMPVYLLGIYIILQIAGLTALALSMLGGAGVIGIVVGFAFRDIAENFLAGILLSIRQPFHHGDLISVSGESGIVSSLNSRSTILVSLEGNHIVIPNSVVFKNVITNYSSAPSRREVLDVGIGYDDSAAQAQEVIAGVLRDHPAVVNDPSPMVLVDALGAATVNLRIYFWFDGHEHSVLKLKSALYRLIKRALTNEGISMPDEAREVVFPNGVPVITSSEATSSKAMAQATTDAAATAAAEPDVAATDAEGGLTNEEAEAEEQAAAGAPPEGGENLLKNGTESRDRRPVS